MTILLVDDEQIAVKTMENIIRQSEFQHSSVFTADNATDAWDIITKEHPDIIFTDIQMPCESGISLLKKIHEAQLDTLLILVSGYSEFSYAQSALRYDAFDYLLKPLNYDTFISCLKSAVSAMKEKENEQMQKEMLEKFFKENRLLLKKQYMETLLLNPVSGFSPEFLHQCISLGLNPQQFCLMGVRCNANNRVTIHQNQEYYISYSISQKINK